MNVLYAVYLALGILVFVDNVNASLSGKSMYINIEFGLVFTNT